MSGKLHIQLSAGAVVLIALMYFFDGSGILAAAVPAVLVHELGHYSLLRLCGRRVTCLRIGIFGLEMDYAGYLDGTRAVLCIAAGPLFGLTYAVMSCRVGGKFAELSGALSFVLSIFNLLPVLPLDGGRLVAEITNETFAGRLSAAASLILLLGGAAVLLRFRTISLLIPAVWLVLYNFRV